MKREFVLLGCIIFTLLFIAAQNYNMEISVISEDKIVQPGEKIQLKINLQDAESKLINDQVLIIIRDNKENILKETTIFSNKIEEIEISEDAFSGEGEITATYQGEETTETFFVGEKEIAEFKIENEKLIITNTGNTKYDKKVYITIGDTTGTKTLNLNVGESTSYRLIAPEGTYNIKITDGETTLTKGDVKLTGTGNVVGAIDESSSKPGITGGISPDENSDVALLNYVKKSSFIYVFILVVFGAAVLLAIERRVKKKQE